SDPARTSRLKLRTRPATTATGRRSRTRTGGVEPGSGAPASTGAVPPATSTTGRTGTMQGEIPARKPATIPITSSSAIRWPSDEVQEGGHLWELGHRHGRDDEHRPTAAVRPVHAVHRDGALGRHPGRRRRSVDEVGTAGDRKGTGGGGDEDDRTVHSIRPHRHRLAAEI